MIDPDRLREVDRRINERFLTAPGQRDAYAHDPMHHANIKILRQLLTATEQAMAAEGISEDIRDRVTYRLLYGDAPESYGEPDFREAHNRMVDRDVEIQRLAAAPLLPPGFREEWKL